LRYQYRLEGASEDWSQLADQRTVNFANLAPGSYRFQVRAVNAAGVMSQSPASSSFTILRPIWQRWWFLLLAGMSAGLVAYALYRYRVARLVELERVRTRIATDLHDDIGSNLSLIAMVSEVAHQQAKPGDRQMADWLSLVAGTSRETVDSMSDIVWAVNPKRDRIPDLIRRMRRVAEDLFNARHIEFHFAISDQEKDIKLGAETRREVFMIFKEAVNNLVRHSQCTRAEVEFQIEQSRLRLRLRDDGKGFDLATASDGNGLQSMRRRAENLGAELEVLSRPGAGTTVTLLAPLDRRNIWNRRSTKAAVERSDPT
jgi:signal transduction histidine kinase